MSLDNNTPAQACGIDVKGNNKWLTIIQDASKNEPTLDRDKNLGREM